MNNLYGAFDLWRNRYNLREVQYLDFDLNPTATIQTGRLMWDSTNGTLKLGLPGGVVELQLGQEINFQGKNNEAVTITDGSPVYISSASGGIRNIKYAIASNYDISEKTIGLATENITKNNFGYVTTFGMVNDVNTNSWNEGDTLWLSDTLGQLTNIKPTSNNLIRIGIVVYKHSNNGKIFVNVVHEHQKFGDVINGNYSEFEQDGTYIAYGNATTVRDELGDITKLKVTGTRITYDDAESILNFSTTTVYTVDYVWTNVQLNHDRLLTAIIDPHIHWFQSENNVPNFLLQYRWQINGGSKVTAWTNYKCNTKVFNYSSGTIHQICDGSGITPPAGSTISDIVQFRLTRDNSNGSAIFSGTDPYTTSVGILSFDVHIFTDTLGSRSEYSK